MTNNTTTKPMKQTAVEWLHKGEGGEWYEPYISNKDLIQIGTITFVTCIMIVTLIILI
jgi:hypothetical protein